jgi:HEAT repeat protein
MAEKAPRLEIFGDSPTTEDGLGFDDYVDILLELIGNFDPESPLTIGIHGMKMLKNRFEDDEGVKTVWFNAWAYGDEPIGLALLQQILIEFQKEEGLKEKGETLLGNVVKLGTDALLRKITMITLEEAKEIFENSIGIKSTLRHDFEAAIDECLQDGRRLVVFIDDLDRCLPEKTIEILEVIKLFLDVPKCIFVIGVEKEVIERGIEVRYKSKEQKPISGKDYIEKIIQIPFVLPPIREEDMAAFIEKLGIGERERGYVTIVAKGTGCNPRKVKMFLNVLRIRRAIAERTGGKIEPDRSAKLFVFEHVFPEFYKDVVKYKHQDILCKLERLASGYAEEEFEELANSKLLQKYHEDGDLGSLLRDEPFFCGIDIEPYIYLSGTEASQEAMVFDESILDELLSADSVKINNAVYAVSRMPDSEKQRLSNAIISKLKDEDTSVRRNAARALGAIGNSRVVKVLEAGSKDEDTSVRRNATSVLEAICDAGAVGALEEALKDVDVLVRGDAARALGAIGDAGAVGALKEALKDEDASVRRSVAVALGRISDAGAVEELKDALKDEDALVRGFAAKALGAIGDAGAVGALKEALGDDAISVCLNVVRALGAIGDTRAVEALEEALKEGYPTVRENAAEALGGIGDTRAVEALMKALGDLDAYTSLPVGDESDVEARMEAEGEIDIDVRTQIISALGRIGDTRAVEMLIVELRYVQDESVRMALVDALRHIGDPRAVVALMEALRDEDAEVRGRAALALGDMDDARAVEALKETLKDADVGVCRYAAEALEKIETKQKSTNIEAENYSSDK